MNRIAERFSVLGRLKVQPWLVAAGYLLVAFYMTAPIHESLSTRFIGGDTGDAYEMARHVWWYKTALQNGEDVFQHSLLGYPEGFSAVQLWANPLQFFPMWLFAFIMPLAAAYNITILLTLALNGWSMYLLARQRLSPSQNVPAFFAGLIFMVFPTLQGHLFAGHAGLLAQWPLPLFIICLFRFADDGGSRRYLRSVVMFVLAAMGHTLQMIYVLWPLTLLFLLARLHRRDYVGAIRLIAVATLGCFLLLLFLSPILAETLSSSQFAGTGGYVRYSIDLLGIVSPSFENPFWQDIATHSARVLGTNLGEGASYIGLLGGLLALLGLIYRRETGWWLMAATVAWVLALGPLLKINDQALTASIAGYDTIVPLPTAFFINLPVLELARTPGRFMFLFMVMFAMIAGYGMSVFWSSRLIQRRHRVTRMVLGFLIAFLIIEDYRLFGAFPSVPAEIPNAIHELKLRRDIRAIYNAPYDNLLAAKEAMYLQTAHGKPLIAGHDTRATAVDPARLALLAGFAPSLLADAGADVVIVNKDRALENRQLADLYWNARQQLGQPLYEDQRFVVFDTPTPSNSPPAFHSTLQDDQSHFTYIHKEQPGWLEFSATLEAENRRVHLSLNDSPLETLEIDGRIPLSIPLPIARRGYHTFRIALDPPCPARIDTSLLVCQGVTLDAVDVSVLSSGAIYDPIRLEDGIVLAGYFMPEESSAELAIRLWWQFEADRSLTDVRFVHILDQNGRPADQDDHSFGAIAGGRELTETVKLDISELPAGEYSVLIGWYELPELRRYDVLTDVDGAQDNTVVLGTVQVE